jgi:catechol 2,3-dioxygenase-like lactoylglutathione lyase family enzyme
VEVLGTQRVVQLGLVVRDVERTAEAYASLLGLDVPGWTMTDPEPVAQTRYRGGATEARAKLAFLDLGSVRLELIEPVGGPSTWQEFLDAHGEGVHHIAFVIEGMGRQIAMLEGRGMPLIQRGEYTGGRYAYIDSTEELKLILELLEND